MKAEFESRRVVISGGGSGIGRAIALAFAARGAAVRIVGIDEAALAEVAALGPDRIDYACCDIRDEARWAATIRAAAPLDVMVNNAAISHPVPLSEAGGADWNNVFSTNFQGTLVGCREAAELMKARGGGRIVNISSVQGRLHEPGGAAYGIAKAGIEQLTRGLAVELAKHRILVNAVAPGFVDTPMSSATGVNELRTDWFRVHYIESGRLPMGRAAQPEEIAAAVLFLAGEGNSYITGQVLTIDGGLTLTL